MQCLFNAPKFSQYFANGTSKKELNRKHKDLAVSFGNLVEKIHKFQDTSSSYTAESTYELKKALGNIFLNTQ